MAASMSKPPQRMASDATTPPSEMTAVSEVPPPDVDHHVADGLVDGEPGADGRGHRLLDQVRSRGAGSVGRLLHRPTLDDGDGRRHADERPRGRLRRDTPQRWSSNRIIRSVMSKSVIAPCRKRPDGHDVARGAADHLPGVLAHGEDLVGPGVEGDHRGLVEDDALAPRVDEGVGGAEVDGEIPSHVAPLARRPCYG